ncbi:hypothetical protein [Dryocola sp. BD626]|uniref:hypothetical protein n=1 Tax=Dryocola sp. BD626 TaxID=3133273 RepID=UPI003F50AF1D
MSDKSNIELIINENGNSNAYGVMLPCEPASFGSFISKLLGKPQVIDKIIPGSFRLDKEDVICLHHLIHQRINQQNESSFIQFTAKMFFDDNSTVQINTIEEFSNYLEIKKVICTSLELSWVYLISFKNKGAPEKQQINVSFGRSDYRYRYQSNIGLNRKFITADNLMLINIMHTERSWGVDMESLISTQLSNFIDSKKSYNHFIYKNHESIGLVSGCLLFAGFVAGGIISTSKFVAKYQDAVDKLTQGGSDVIMSQKIDFLLSLASTGAWPRYVLALVFFLVIASVISIVAGTWISSNGESKLQSWILLTDKSRNEYDIYKENLNKSMLLFFGSILTSVVCGIIGNVIFNFYFTT